MRCVHRMAATAGVLASLSFEAGAQNYVPWLTQIAVARPGGFYGWVGGQVRWIETPEFNSHVSVGESTTPRLVEDPTITTGGFAGSVGYVTDWSGFGRLPRFELHLGALTGTSSQRFNYDFLGTDAFRSVDGQQSGLQGGDGQSQNNLKVKMSSVDLALRFKTDFVLAPQWTLTPSIAIIGGTVNTRYYEAGSELFNGGGSTTNSTTVKLDTSHFGGEVRLEGAWRPQPDLAVVAGGAFGIMYQRTGMKANDCAGSFVLTGVAATCDGTFFQTRASQARNVTNYRATGALGLIYSWGWAQAGIMGLVSWNSDVPGVRVPTGGTAGAITGPASIYYGGQLSYGFTAGLIIPLN